MKDIFYFEELNMASHYDKGKIHNVVLDVETQPGYFAVISGVAQGKSYGDTILNYSTFEADAPEAVGDIVVVLDPSSVSEVGYNGNIYRVGNELFGNAVPAGVPVRARELRPNDIFYLGAKNIEGTPVKGQFAVLKASGAFTLVPSADLTTHEGFAVEIINIEAKTTGAVAGFPVIACRVVQL